MPIAPIDAQQQERVVAETHRCIRRAGRLLASGFQMVPVRFELQGRAAGMYRVHKGERVIRYNPYIFSKYFDDSLANTVPHEVAHYITEVLYGLVNVRPHGREWQNIMRMLGAEPSVTCRYDLTGIPLRRQRHFIYRCACTRHALSAVRHKRSSSGKARYYCRHCRKPVIFSGAVSDSAPGTPVTMR
ncbi:MAG: SprT-like domain-containing protein [Gammaproteobacteria bacterium]